MLATCKDARVYVSEAVFAMPRASESATFNSMFDGRRHDREPDATKSGP